MLDTEPYATGTIERPVEDEIVRTVEKPARLGEMLRDARVALELSLEDVSQTTRVSMRYLAAIENSRFDQFSSRIYAVGFVRAYARMVHLPERWAADLLRAEAGWR